MKKFFFLSIVGILMACNSEPKDIKYGQDNCDYCHMTVVDEIHGTELVTDKGKVYIFDSMECLVNFKNEHEHKYSHEMTNYFEVPGKLMPIKDAFLLKSDQLPSPMGGNVTAFQTQEKLQQIMEEKGGKEVSYSEAQEILKK
ncbi:nitrous oxide reductase accessory protein NosL [Weeksellaceae bacterium TAE3-ERU29]|nr:nitrous oxide reductase accessory protein NosL [Weeksellaceae bacterium TAE3-ERU29]